MKSERESPISFLRAEWNLFVLRLWWWARERAIAAMNQQYPSECSDARRAWNLGARLAAPLDDPNAWNTRGLRDDLLLHDAAGSLLGRNA